MRGGSGGGRAPGRWQRANDGQVRGFLGRGAAPGLSGLGAALGALEGCSSGPGCRARGVRGVCVVGLLLHGGPWAGGAGPQAAAR